MDIYLLFRKKPPLTEEGRPVNRFANALRGALEREFTARRNSSGRAVVSVLLVRSLLAYLDGAVSWLPNSWRYCRILNIANPDGN
jgi:hypothetical protein